MKYSILFLLLFCCACNGRDSCNTMIVINPKYVVSVPNKESNELMYSTMFSSVDYVPLEDSPESKIGGISTLLIAADSSLIVFDKLQRVVLRFDSNGHFLNKIGEAGRSKDEYVNPKSVKYDKYNNWVMINDHPKKAILCYNLQGEFVKEIRLDDYIDAFGVVDQFHIAVFCNYQNQKPQKNREMDLKVLNHQGHIVYENFPYSHLRLKFQPECNNVFQETEDGLLFFPPLSSAGYIVSLSGMYPFLYYSFGESNDLSKENIYQLYTTEPTSNYFLPIYYFNNRLIGNIVSGNKANFFYADIKGESQPIYISFSNIKNDIKGKVKTGFVRAVTSSQVYFVFYPYSFQEIKESLPIITSSDSEIIDCMAQFNNPIIQICHL